MGKMFFLAAGGTGGHLFPAYALAQELFRRGHTLDLVTDERGDRFSKDFPARVTHRIPAAAFAGKSLKSVAAGAKLMKGVAASRSLLAYHKPDAILGFGGYPTFPPMLAASMRGVPCAVHEANAVMGRANRALARRMTIVATSFEDTKYLDKVAKEHIRVTGLPLRDAVIELGGRSYEPSRDGEFRLLVFGGSQGASFFSDVIPEAVGLLDDRLKSRLRITQQCRAEDLERVARIYRDAGVPAELAEFFPSLPKTMVNAHLVFARAGASSVMELATLGRPSILVPLPHALDNDQLANATRLSESGGAWCAEQSTLDARTVADGLAELMDDPETLAAAAAAAAEQARPDAVQRLADLAEELASQRAA